MSLIKVENVCFSYSNNFDPVAVLSDLSLTVDQGSFIVITGPNGKGKSTLAKLLNGLLIPDKGKVSVAGYDTADSNNIKNIRKTLGLVFQNPDNQILADTVEDDVAFGPENLGLSSEEIEKRVSEALDKTGISELRFRNPNKLSGGQKQRLAIAGVLAMKCRCIVLDEATSMLDPQGRKDVLDTLHNLNREENTTVILITHRPDECIDCDKVYVLENGSLRET